MFSRPQTLSRNNACQEILKWFRHCAIWWASGDFALMAAKVPSLSWNGWRSSSMLIPSPRIEGHARISAWHCSAVVPECEGRALIIQRFSWAIPTPIPPSWVPTKLWQRDLKANSSWSVWMLQRFCDRYLQLLRKSREVGACICELKVRVRHGKEVMQAIGGVQPLL